MTSTSHGAAPDARDGLVMHSGVALDKVVGQYQRSHSQIFFLQVGAFDGVTSDPIYPLVENYNLSGILIEPQWDAFQRLKRNYAHLNENRFHFINAAIGARDGQVPLFRIRGDVQGPYWLHGIASLKRETVMWHAPSFPPLQESISIEQVQCYCFETLFRKLGTPHVDLLQIDAEGYDAEILSLFDVATRRPAIIHFEHRHLAEEMYLVWHRTLNMLGYRVETFEEDALAYALTT